MSWIETNDARNTSQSNASQKKLKDELEQELKEDIPVEIAADNRHDTIYRVPNLQDLVTSIKPHGVEFTKHDTGKPRYSLIPPLAEEELVKVLTFGAEKYSADNWRKVDDPKRYVDAAMRHIAAYRKGDTLDSESGLHHLAHAMCCLAFITELELKKQQC